MYVAAVLRARPKFVSQNLRVKNEFRRLRIPRPGGLRRVTVWRRVGSLLNVAGDKEIFFRPLLALGGDSESVADFDLPSYACEGLLERCQWLGTGSLSRAASALQLA